jgi:hypothetical protein
LPSLRSRRDCGLQFTPAISDCRIDQHQALVSDLVDCQVSAAR